MVHLENIVFGGLLAITLAGTAYGQALQAASCNAATDRCTSTTRLLADGNETFATVSLQVGKTGAEPVLYVVAPLGIAARPGVRVVLNPGATEIELPLDVCFPDGCRASTDLTADQLSQLSAAQDLSIQFIPFSSDETVAGELEAASVISPLTQAGVALP